MPRSYHRAIDYRDFHAIKYLPSSTFYKNQQKSHIIYTFAFNQLACLKKDIVAEFCGNYKAIIRNKEKHKVAV